MAGFLTTLKQIRERAGSETEKGRLFERLMRQFFREDPVYRKRFSEVWLWADWAATQPGESGRDTGVDLVAKEAEGDGFCAIQTKCYAESTRIGKPHVDSFISASNRKDFTARIFVDTGASWGSNALKTVQKVTPPCQVLRFNDLDGRPFDWPDLDEADPEALAWNGERFSLRPHQREAFDDVTAGFRKDARGQLIMACGTGKTFTALRIAEAVAGTGKRVLYLVPSISLFQQSLREWATHRELEHRYVGICSDTRAGRTSEDASILELEIPVTTDPGHITEALKKEDPTAMTVVFSTYHSLPLVERAQDAGAPQFDLVLCDEAHRTTGVERPGDKTSPFVLVHLGDRIRAEKRLYMTATPRLYTGSAKRKAARHDIEVFSMDDRGKYGPEFHRLPFSKAVKRGLLSDYRVVVLGLREESIVPEHGGQRRPPRGELPISDTTKIVGAWRALQNPEDLPIGSAEIRPLRRVIAFTNTIAASKRVEKHGPQIVSEAIEALPEVDRKAALGVEIQHVDGKSHALERKARIEWLKGETEGGCRIVSNARCLSEGIDVPALDAVVFLSPKNSHVDIVQAVGRTMRQADGKKYGYIVLPIALPPGVEAASALDQNKYFGAVWSVLRALRSHDDRLDAEIQRMDLNRARSERVILAGADGSRPGFLPFPPLDLPPEAIYAKIVEKCGDRKYWETWARDVADIFSRLVVRINDLIRRHPKDLDLLVTHFHNSLRDSLNQSVTKADAVHMLAQHIITRPVFEAVFAHYDFAARNPVAQDLDELRRRFEDFGLEDETRDLEKFYDSVRMRVEGLDNSDARQTVLMELYEKFFATALKKQADRLGIVYTPAEVVDFILASADAVLREEFGKGLSNEGVHILDPFTGTGTFLVRLLRSGLIREEDLERKYRKELHANEIALLAYYVAAVHIEEAFHGRRGGDTDYEPFDGIVLTDTFTLNPRWRSAGRLLGRNSARVSRQQDATIEVIVGNPPWTTQQKSAGDHNPNVWYPDLADRVKTTYASRAATQRQSQLYASQKLALRWASDRIGRQGVVAMVTNGSWITGNVDSGIRACLAEEFTSVHVLDLRGNQRTSGERSRREGGKVFGQGSRAPVAITILVKNSRMKHRGCRIRYRDIGDYLKREEKLDFLRDRTSVAGIQNWRRIRPDRHHDWIDKRHPRFHQLVPIGTRAAKAGRADAAIFGLYSLGIVTSRDAYLYNFSVEACAKNGEKAVESYTTALSLLETTGCPPEVAAKRCSRNLHWDRQLRSNLSRRKRPEFSRDYIRPASHRPFVRLHCYADFLFVNCKYQQDRIFPQVLAQESRSVGRSVGRSATCVPIGRSA